MIMDVLEDVRTIQTALDWNQFDTGLVDGQFGPVTRGAVTQFQDARGLVPDGEVGPLTWDALGLTEWQYLCGHDHPAPAPSTSQSVVQPPPQTSSMGSSFVSLARSKLGAPYVWAATGPNAFDCSGFISYVVRTTIGAPGPRLFDTSSFPSWSWNGYRVIPISESQLQPGDILDHNWGSMSSEQHMGFYSGNGMMIDAGSRGVTERAYNYKPGGWNYFRIVR